MFFNDTIVFIKKPFIFKNEHGDELFKTFNLNISNSSINMCIDGNLKTSGGFIWRNYDGKEIKKYIIIHVIEIKSNKKPVIQYDMQMNKINEFESALDAMRKLKIDSSYISKACRGLAHMAGGFIWKYADKV